MAASWRATPRAVPCRPFEPVERAPVPWPGERRWRTTARSSRTSPRAVWSSTVATQRDTPATPNRSIASPATSPGDQHPLRRQSPRRSFPSGRGTRRTVRAGGRRSAGDRALRLRCHGLPQRTGDGIGRAADAPGVRRIMVRLDQRPGPPHRHRSPRLTKSSFASGFLSCRRPESRRKRGMTGTEVGRGRQTARRERDGAGDRVGGRRHRVDRQGGHRDGPAGDRHPDRRAVRRHRDRGRRDRLPQRAGQRGPRRQRNDTAGTRRATCRSSPSPGSSARSSARCCSSTSPRRRSIIAVIVAIVGYVVLFFAHPDLRTTPARSRRLAPPVGLTAGVFQGAIGISGPIVGSWIHSYRLSRSAHILSVTTLFMLTGLTQLIVLDRQRRTVRPGRRRRCSPASPCSPRSRSAPGCATGCRCAASTWRSSPCSRVSAIALAHRDVRVATIGSPTRGAHGTVG